MTGNHQRQSVTFRIIIVSIILSVGVITAIYLYYNKEVKELKSNRADTLSAIASLKVDQTYIWKGECLVRNPVSVSYETMP